ncbi:MAG: TauD/TfdA family dioxygenase [Novosphingobium sp.]|nr:TauD/TfdA family dioxygenase [Novosphingobium sp.]
MPCRGDLLKGSAFLESAHENPEIFHVGNLAGADGRAAGAGGAYNIDWHNDYSYVDRPGITTFLDAVELPKNPPHTYFLSQYNALETLPPETVENIRGMRAFHAISEYGKKSGGKDTDRLQVDIERDRERGVERPAIPEADHPMVVLHPETGRECLYVDPAITQHAVGMPQEESDALLAELYAHATRPENVYAHDWELGDLVMFDTLGTLHKRDAWDPSERRHMRQMSTVSYIE